MLLLFVLLGAAFAQEPLSADAQLKYRQAEEAFRAHDCAVALDRLREVIAASPNFIAAHYMAGTCSLQRQDYAPARSEFQRALEIQPDEWHSVAGLIQAYALAGMAKQRDAEREHFVRMQKEGKAPLFGSFVIEAFDVGENHVQVAEYPQLTSRLHVRYWFNVAVAQGSPAHRIALKSDDADQGKWAKDHPQEAAAGEREFSLESYTFSAQGGQTHSLIRYYENGEPAYEQVLADVKTFLADNKVAVASSYARAPHPAPIVPVGYPTPLPISPPGFPDSVVGGIPAGVIGGIPGGLPAANLNGVAPPPPPPPPPPASSPDTPARVRLAPNDAAARVVHYVSPVYPELAKQARVQGSVVLQAFIGRDGSVTDLKLISGHPLLTQPALDAVRQWMYKPYLLNGEPVAVETQVTVNFTLR